MDLPRPYALWEREYLSRYLSSCELANRHSAAVVLGVSVYNKTGDWVEDLLGDTSVSSQGGP
jgi:hypothetical protein